MLPALRPGYLLFVRPGVLGIKAGDVIVFSQAQSTGYVAHRVVAAKTAGFITRGDNNPLNDPDLIPPDQVVGRVEIVDVQGILRRAHGGWLGVWRARFSRHARRIGSRLRSLFGAPYRWLHRSRIVSRLWHPVIIQARFSMPDGVIIKYICGRRRVAQWRQDKNRFECSKPYDLVIESPNNTFT